MLSQCVNLFLYYCAVVDNAGDDRTLSNEEQCRLEVNLAFLSDHIRVETVVNDLHAVNCLTTAHKDYLLNLISSSKPGLDLTKELLRVLQRRSLRSFKCFLEYRHNPATLATIKACAVDWTNDVNC